MIMLLKKSMKVNIKMIKRMDMENTLLAMGIYMKDYLKIIKKMVKAKLHLKPKNNLKVILSMIQ